MSALALVLVTQEFRVIVDSYLLIQCQDRHALFTQLDNNTFPTTTTVREQYVFKTMKSREFITQNKTVNESRLIQFFIHESRFNWKKKMRTWKYLNTFNHDSRGKKSPNHASRRNHRGPSCQSRKQTASKFNLFYQILAFTLNWSSNNLVT